MPGSSNKIGEKKIPLLAPAVARSIQPKVPFYVTRNFSADLPLEQARPKHVVLWSPYPPFWHSQVPGQVQPNSANLVHPNPKENTGDVAIGDAAEFEGGYEKLEPKVGILFESEHEAYTFYNSYAEKIGFSIRRSTLWTTSKNVITRRTFVCSREGFREKKKGAKVAKHPRPETRIGCPACMTVRLTSNGKYRIMDFVADHNHQLATLSLIHNLKAKKLRLKAQAVRAELTHDTLHMPEFETEEDAYEYYGMYAGKVGFSIRRASMTVSAENVVTRRVFVCSKEGFREKKKGASGVKNPRPETRTGCPACMVVKLSANGKYQVTEFVTYHNHHLAASMSADLVISHGMEDEKGNSFLGLSDSLSCVRPAKCIKRMHNGDAGAVLEYFQKMQSENPPFFSAVGTNKDGILTNFFWADLKSILDFIHFDDVVCFDTGYRNCGHDRPFALFTGLNHHRQTIIFGAALLYDESAESFEWLFDTFKTAMNQRQPRTILTDRCAVIQNAVSSSWPGTSHRFCVWQIYESALVHLSQVFHGSRTLEYELKRCLFDHEDEDAFLFAWKQMVETYDLKDNAWLRDLFAQKEKWALAYGRDSFYGDLKSVQQKDKLVLELKQCMKGGSNLLQSLEKYEHLLAERRFAESKADLDAAERPKKAPSMRMLRQAADAYTPAAFKMFEREFELYIDCVIYKLGANGSVSEYKVATEEEQHSKDHLVKFDSADTTVHCSCKMFEFAGIPCCHMLKVLDTRNIKDLPRRYISQRWKKDVKKIGSWGVFGHDDDNNLNFSQDSRAMRHSRLCWIFSVAAVRAAQSEESYQYMESQSGAIRDQLEQVLQMRLSVRAGGDWSRNSEENIVAGAGLLNNTGFLTAANEGHLSFPFTALNTTASTALEYH